MRVVIIGLGSIAKKHIKAILEIDENTEIYALRSSENSGSYENVTNLYSFEDIPKVSPDFILISNPTSEHYNTLEQVSQYNIPLFIEKPVLSSLDKSNLLLSQLKDTLTYVACNLRFLDSLNFVSSYLRDKKDQLNEVNVYAGSYLPDWRPNQDFRKVYSAIPELGGGVHLDLIHEIDYTYWLFGKPDEVLSKFTSKSSLDIRAIDSAIYIMEYNRFMLNIRLNYYRRDYKRTLELIFQDETVIVDLFKNKVTNHHGKTLFEGVTGLRDTYTPQMKYFMELVKNNLLESSNSLEDGLKVLKICLNE
ncbi:MAG: Gfo/Idh/MocA family protein [Saprospiraceae bacterium]